MLWWQVFIGPAEETQLGGFCRLEADYCVPSWRGSGIVLRFRSERGRVLSHFLIRACAHRAPCDLDCMGSHALCLLVETNGTAWTRQKILGRSRHFLWSLLQFMLLRKEKNIVTAPVFLAYLQRDSDLELIIIDNNYGLES